MGGLSLTASTGVGAPIPGPYLLASVAAVVLGGVTLGGGKGGLLGPIVAVFILRLVRTDLTLLAVDPNVTSIVEGTHHGRRRDVRRLHRHAGQDAMTPTDTPPPARRLRRFMADYPLVPLLVLLLALVLVLQILRPGIVNERWIANTVKFAIPLAMLAGAQTLAMLTGGIDLSVSTVATMAAFIVATQSVDPARPGRLCPRLPPGAPDRRRQRHRHRRLPGPPADHDPRDEPDRHRLPAGLPAHRHRLGHQDPRRPRLARHRAHLRRPERAGPLPARSRRC